MNTLNGNKHVGDTALKLYCGNLKHTRMKFSKFSCTYHLALAVFHILPFLFYLFHSAALPSLPPPLIISILKQIPGIISLISFYPFFNPYFLQKRKYSAIVTIILIIIPKVRTYSHVWLSQKCLLRLNCLHEDRIKASHSSWKISLLSQVSCSIKSLLFMSFIWWRNHVI